MASTTPALRRHSRRRRRPRSIPANAAERAGGTKVSMGKIVDERVLRFVLPALAAALIAPLPQAACAQETSWRDAADNGGAAAQIRHEIADHANKDLRPFYAARDNAPLWLDAFDRPSDAATLLLLRMRTADRDGGDPAKLDLDKLSKALDHARDGGASDAAKAALALSAAFVEYVPAMRGASRVAMLYESPALAPSPPGPR